MNDEEKQKFLNAIAKWAIYQHSREVQSYFQLTDQEMEELEEKLTSLDEEGELI
tara:strand:+ start:130 stop:291 length:162 start_codon:yes stop_codon:yes gene_type:complete